MLDWICIPQSTSHVMSTAVKTRLGYSQLTAKQQLYIHKITSVLIHYDMKNILMIILVMISRDNNQQFRG